MKKEQVKGGECPERSDSGVEGLPLVLGFGHSLYVVLVRLYSTVQRW